MIAAVVGGQFGSEGKGLIVGHIAKDYDVHVRVGAANAGHTVYTSRFADVMAMEGMPGDRVYEKHVMQQLPCAAYTNPEAELVLGAGAMISAEILEEEIALNDEWRRIRAIPPAKIYIDWRAHVVTEEHVATEQNTDLAERIGSTSTIAKEGIGAAQAARVMRTDYLLARDDVFLPRDPRVTVCDTVEMLHARHKRDNKNILLEGTQGTGLSNTTGEYPYVTSRNTTAAGLAADCGVPPNALERVILVCRSYPIRVAGNSGPFASDSEEIAWEDLRVDPEKERTTVTKKVRRVASFSSEQLVESAWLNGATEVAFTFADYIDPQIVGVSAVHDRSDEIGRYPLVGDFVAQIEAYAELPVRYVGTGPHSVIERHPLWMVGDGFSGAE